MTEPRLRLVSAGGGGDVDALVRQVARGDSTAFEQLYDVLAASVYGLALRVVRDPARAEDVTQDVFLDVWRKATGFDRQLGKARTWVMTIAHRRAVDRVRSESATSLREQKVLPGPVTGDDVAELVETALDWQRVRRCLGTLTTVQAEAIKLAYYGGYTYAQTAELLGVALGTVKTRIRDGLIRLRDCLGVAG